MTLFAAQLDGSEDVIQPWSVETAEAGQVLEPEERFWVALEVGARVRVNSCKKPSFCSPHHDLAVSDIGHREQVRERTYMIHGEGWFVMW